MKWIGRISLVVSLCLVGGVAASQEAETAPTTEGSGSSGATASSDDDDDRPRRRRHTKSRRSRRRSRSRSSSSSSSSSTSGSGSLSVGRHNRGRILRSAELTDTDHLRIRNPSSDHHYGTEEMVTLLRDAADHVWSRLPGSRLTVADLSRHRGGRFRPHRSHQSGRDVDVGFYILDDVMRVIDATRFVDFRDDGTTSHDATWRFDDARNWAFVESLVMNTTAPVQYMFVSRELRTRLLAHANANGADPEAIARAETVLWQPSSGGRHRDHFHVRIYCDAGDQPRCNDEAPYHPWTRGISALDARAAAAAADADGTDAVPTEEPEGDAETGEAVRDEPGELAE